MEEKTLEKYLVIKKRDDFKKRLEEIHKVINYDNLKIEIKDYESLLDDPLFWQDQEKSKKVTNFIKIDKEKIQSYNVLAEYLADIEMIIEMNEDEYFESADELIYNCEKSFQDFETKLLLSHEFDINNAIVEIHPGAGGTESQDWAFMLFRMYKRFSENSDYKFEMLDYQEANEAGIKSVSFIIKGEYAYGKLKSENGVHRLVRISPFDSNARRHTSFASVLITPELNNDIVVKINSEDIRVDTYRSSGAGGQHVNTTDSAVRITHLPTGIVVSCQNERSQIQNKERAMVVLKSKIYQQMEKEKELRIKEINGEQNINGFGSQIRSYVLHPYQMVKDHRTQKESSNPENVLDGQINEFIDAYLKYIKGAN